MYRRTPDDFNFLILSVFLSIASIVVVLASNASGPGLLVGGVIALAAVIVTPSPP